MQITSRKGPLERFGGPLVAGLKGHNVSLQFGQPFEVAWGEQLTLNDREVDLDLVEPAGVNRRMDQNDVGPSGGEAISGARRPRWQEPLSVIRNTRRADR